MSNRPTVARMSRSVYEQLPDDLKFPFPNPDGTVTVDRLRSGEEYFAHEVELVDGPLFPLGQVVVTTALLAELDEAGIDTADLAGLLERHQGGDWGELPAEDLSSNDEAVHCGDRILSAYSLGPVRVWAITEWDRSATTLLRPDSTTRGWTGERDAEDRPRVAACRTAPTIYLSGACSPALAQQRHRRDLGVLVQPATAQYAAVAPAFAGGFALDNGCFSSRARFNEERWFAWLAKMPRAGCHFAVAPDVVADARATWARSAPWLEPIRVLGFPAALVFQDGIEATEIPWASFDTAFIGGSTPFKVSGTAADLMAEARRHGKWVHVGRVNSLRRLRFAASSGADSVDGTFLAYGPRANLPRLLSWLDDLAC